MEYIRYRHITIHSLVNKIATILLSTSTKIEQIEALVREGGPLAALVCSARRTEIENDDSVIEAAAIFKLEVLVNGR